METGTLEELLEEFKEQIYNEIEAEGLNAWSLNTSGINLLDSIADYDYNELKDLLSELREGLAVEVTLDLSEYLVDHVSELISERENRFEDLEENDEDIEELKFD